LLVATRKRTAGEIPCKPENARSLFCGDPVSTVQVVIEKRPQLGVSELRCRRRSEEIVRADQTEYLVDQRELGLVQAEAPCPRLSRQGFAHLLAGWKLDSFYSFV
jgi:hypothetical protein